MTRGSRLHNFRIVRIQAEPALAVGNLAEVPAGRQVEAQWRTVGQVSQVDMALGAILSEEKQGREDRGRAGLTLDHFDKPIDFEQLVTFLNDLNALISTFNE